MAAKKPKKYGWTCIGDEDFGGRLPVIWVHPRRRRKSGQEFDGERYLPGGEGDGIPITFSSKAELRQLLLSLAPDAGLQLVIKPRKGTAIRLAKEQKNQ